MHLKLIAGLEAAVLNIRSVGCNQLHSMTTWAPFAIGHGYHSDVRAGENTGKERIAVIGSGNWGSVAAKLVATNALSHENIHGTWVLST